MISRAGVAGLLLLACFVGLILSPRLLARAMCSLFELIASESINFITINSISLFSMSIEGFEVEYSSQHKALKINVSWSSLRVSIYWDRVFKAHSSMSASKIERLVEVVFTDLHVEFAGVSFNQLLNPGNPKPVQSLPLAKAEIIDEYPDITTPRSRNFDTYDKIGAILNGSLPLFASIAQIFLGCIKLQFETCLDFAVIMPENNSKIVGSCNSASVYFMNSTTTLAGILCAMDVREGAMDVYYDGLETVEYFGQLAQFRMDYHVPSGMQAVSVNLFGKDEAAVSIQPFLAFYEEYQKAEDNSYEIKLARKLPTLGKMHSISMHLKQMKISLKDPRSLQICLFEIEDMSMQMRTFSMTSEGRRYVGGLNYIYRLISDIKESSSKKSTKTIELLTGNVEKVLNISTSSVRWLAHDKPSHLHHPSSAVVKNARMTKVLSVMNSGDFIDNEIMKLSIDLVDFQRVSPPLLEWLFIMQDTSNSVPSSRFSHLKKSTLMASNKKTVFSTSPSDPREGSALEDSDELVVFSFTNAEATRTSLPRQDSSLVDGKADLVEIHSSLFLGGLSSRYKVHVELSHSGIKQLPRIGMLWSMSGLSGKMSMGVKTVFHGITIREGLNVSYTAENPKQLVTAHVRKSSEASLVLEGDESTSDKPKRLRRASKQNRHSFTFSNERTLNPNMTSKIQSVFMKSSVFRAVWSGSDVQVELGDVDIIVSFGGAIKALCSFNMIRETVNRVLGHMSRIKAIPKIEFSSNHSPRPRILSSGNRTPGFKSPGNYSSKQSKTRQKISEEKTLEPSYSAIMKTMRVQFALGMSTPFSMLSIGQYATKDTLVPLSMEMNMTSVEIIQSASRQSYKWKSGEVWFNNWMDRPAFIFENFSYESNTAKNPTGTSIRKQSLRMTKFNIGMSTLHNFGDTWLAFNTQYDAYRIANAIVPGSKDSLGKSISWDDMQRAALNDPRHLEKSAIYLSEQAKVRADPFLLEMFLDSFTINMDGPFEGRYCRDLAELKYDNFSFSLDASQKELDMYSEIASLDNSMTDESPANSYLLHSNASGGLVNAKFKTFKLKFSGMDSSTLMFKDVSVSGPLYSASIDDPRVAVKSTSLSLADVSTNRSIDNNTSVAVSIKKSTAPSKTYTRLEVISDECRVVSEVRTSACISAFNYALRWYQIPNEDSMRYPMAWWDGLRYSFHGSYLLHVKTFSVHQYLHQSDSERTKVTVVASQFNFFINGSSLQISCVDFDVDAEIWERSNHHKRKTAQSSSELIRIPGIVLSLNHSYYKDKIKTTRKSTQKSYSHHDVYLSPCQVEYPEDKFALFRSKQRTIKWTVELLCTDTPDKPILVYARLNVISALLKSLVMKNILAPSVPIAPTTPAGMPTSPVSSQVLKNSNNIILMRFAAMIVKQLQDIKAPAPFIGIALTDVVQSLDLQIGVNNLIVCSWPSPLELEGIVFSQQRMEVQLRMQRKEQDLASNADSSTTEPNSLPPLVVEHMFTEIHFVELYVRAWVLSKPFNKDSTMDSPSTSRRNSITAQSTKNLLATGLNRSSLAFHGTSNVLAMTKEPRTIEEIKSLMIPIFKLAHATKLEVSLTEDGAVCSKNLTFRSIGIIDENDNDKLGSAMQMSSKSAQESCAGVFYLRSSHGLIHFKLGRNQNSNIEFKQEVYRKFRVLAILNESTDNLRVSSSVSPSEKHTKRISKGKSSKTDPNKASRLRLRSSSNGEYRPKLSAFAANHAALTPPKHALPASYQGSRTTNLLAARSLMSMPLSAASALQRNSSTEDSFGTKIWGLRIIDIRLLWTLEMRDVLFIYIYKYFNAVSNVNEPLSTEGVASDNVNAPAPSTPGPSSNAKAIIADFLKVEREYPLESSDLRGKTQQPEASASRRRSSSKPIQLKNRRARNEAKALLESNIESNSQLSSKLPNQLNNSQLLAQVTDNNDNRINLKEEFASSMSQVGTGNRELKTGNELNSPGKRRTSPQRGVRSDILESTFDPLKEQKLRRRREINSKRTLSFHRAFDDDSGLSPMRSPDRKSMDTPDAKTLIGESADSRDKLQIKEVSPMTENSFSPAVTLTPSPPLSPRKRAASIAANAAAQRLKSLSSSRMFVVELIDPQINFLDTNSHSSIIIIAGRSYLEGVRGNGAFQPPSKQHAVNTPKRKRELKLRMDGVSAYTVPTAVPSLPLSPDSEFGASDEESKESDIVHWKVLDNTITSPTNIISSPRFSRRASVRVRNASQLVESPNLRVAIKDFKIRAQYTFWMDVLSTEARSMTVFLAREELLDNFLLDLPEVVVDTDSAQFYVVLNVIRNLLLVPPPPIPKLDIPTDEPAESAGTKPHFVELKKDEKILEKHGLKLTGDLDISHRNGREVVKALIEESLVAGTSTIAELSSGMTRVVQVFIGKGVWLLRSHANASNHVTPSSVVETGFTGVYANFTFHEDRSSSVLFETQRFWAKNLTLNSTLSSDNTTSDVLPAMPIDSEPLESWVVIPVLADVEPCERCGAIFSTESNHASSCIFHADEDGSPGEYKEIMLKDELTGSPAPVWMWSCCGRTQLDAPGCSSRPHVCKEVMISIRGETNPTVSIDGLEVQVIQALDISFFPGALYDLRVQLSRTLADTLHNFFSIEPEDIAAIEKELTANDGDKDGSPLVSDEGASGHESKNQVKQKSLAERLGINSLIGSPLKSTGNLSAHQTEKSRASSAPAPLIITTDEINESPARKEGVYINYLRVGDINVDVSTSGFPINVDNYRAVVEPYICRGEVQTWQRLIGNLERHALVSVTKSIAHNLGNRIGNLFLGNRLSYTSRVLGVPRSLSTLTPGEASTQVDNAKREQLLGKSSKNTKKAMLVSSLLNRISISSHAPKK